MHHVGKRARRALAVSFTLASLKKSGLTSIARFAARAVLGCGALIVFASQSASASPLGTGDTVIPVLNGSVGGTLEEPALVASFSAASFSGTLTSMVFSGDTSSPHHHMGGLTFTYLLQNDLESDHPLGRLTVNGFAGFEIDAIFSSAFSLGSGREPTLVNRPTADFVGFSFIDGIPGSSGSTIPPGTSSFLLVLRTDATEYVRSTASVIDGHVATAPTFAPVPEPSTLLALGSMAAAALLRRRR